MHELPTESILDAGGDLAERVWRATRKLAAQGPHGRLILGPEVRPDSALVEALSAALEANPSLRELDLVHPSAMAGFVASTLQLRAKSVTVRAVRVTDDPASAPPPARPPRRRSSPGFEIQVAREHGRARITTLRSGYSRDDIVDAFSRSRAEGCSVLVFEDTGRPTRELVQWLEEALRGEPLIVELALVHASPAIGFLTSSLSLQVPSVRVRAARSVAELNKAS